MVDDEGQVEAMLLSVEKIYQSMTSIMYNNVDSELFILCLFTKLKYILQLFFPSLSFT